KLGERLVIPPQIAYADMPAFYHALDLFCQPSHYETFGMAAAEAMASGVPVAGARVGGLAELLDESCAFFCEPHHVASLQTAFNAATSLTRDELRARGVLARQRIEHTFSAIHTANAWQQLLSQSG